MFFDDVFQNVPYFVGYAFYLFLCIFNHFFSQTIQMGTRAWVGARKISQILRAVPMVGDAALEPDRPEVDWPRATLTDGATGVRIKPGRMTALVAASPLETSGIAARLTRVDDADTTYVDGVDLRSYPLAEVREHVVLSGAEDVGTTTALLVALAHPMVALVLALLMLAAMVAVFFMFRRFVRDMFGPKPPPSAL